MSRSAHFGTRPGPVTNDCVLAGYAVVLIIMFALVGLMLYFIPTLLAMVRHHHRSLSVFLVNFLLGWTILGWFVALFIAMTTPRWQRQWIDYYRQGPPPPPYR